MVVTDDAHLVQNVEKKAREPSDAISQLMDQVPQPCPETPPRTHLALEDYALLTRDFNVAMGLPVGSVRQCLTKERGNTYGRMLREEVQELLKKECFMKSLQIRWMSCT